MSTFTNYVIHYLLVGIIWAILLEYYTTRYVEGEAGKPWTWSERCFHWFIWPLSLSVFFVEFFKQVWNNK